MMTPSDIYAEYLRREQQANRTARGADPVAIIRKLAADYHMDQSEVKEIVLDHGNTLGAG